jgi:predicted Fe-Mo cluster-binding NifX family protein
VRIATFTNNGRVIGQHFGRAPYYIIVMVENGQILNRERRDKLGHAD